LFSIKRDKLNMTKIVEVRNLFFEYFGSQEKTLKEINFSIEKGKCLAILGGNGSGKTTLIYHLNGIIPHAIKGKGNGIVKVLNTEVKNQSISEISKNVCTVLQDPEAQIIGSTVYTQCASHLSNLEVKKEEIEKKVKQSLEEISLSTYWHTNPKKLSYGQMQKLSIATSLSVSPQLLLLDEPISHIDAKSGEEIINLLNKLKQQKGMSLIIATQKSEYIKEIADEILVLQKGKISHYGEPREVFYNLLKEKVQQIEIPRISVLINKLNIKTTNASSGFPITVEEGYNLLSGIINKKKFPTKKHVKSDNQLPILSLRNVSFSYFDGTKILNDISFDVFQSKCLGIVGKNGAGKTTLARVLLKLLKPYKGNIKYMDVELQKYPNDRLYNEIGLVLQHPEHQLLGKAVEEEIKEVLKNKNYDKNEIELRIQESLKIVSLEEKRNFFSGKLSYGEKKKLSIATVIATRPNIIILDEPSTGIDYKSRIEIADALNKLKKNGCAIIIITHDMEYISDYADEIIVLHEGVVSMQGTPQEIFANIDKLQESGLRMPELAKLGNLSNINFPSFAVDKVARFLKSKMK